MLKKNKYKNLFRYLQRTTNHAFFFGQLAADIIYQTATRTRITNGRTKSNETKSSSYMNFIASKNSKCCHSSFWDSDICFSIHIHIQLIHLLHIICVCSYGIAIFIHVMDWIWQRQSVVDALSFWHCVHNAIAATNNEKRAHHRFFLRQSYNMICNNKQQKFCTKMSYYGRRQSQTFGTAKKKEMRISIHMLFWDV